MRKKSRRSPNYIGTGTRMGRDAGFRQSAKARIQKEKNVVKWDKEARDRGITVAQLLVEKMSEE